MFYRKRRIFLKNNYKETLTYTLNKLKEYEIEAANNRDFETLVLSLFPNTNNIYLTVYNFVRSTIEYRDDRGDEMIIHPLRILGLKYGDCDDMALLIKTILTTLGVESHYLLLGRRPGEYTHIIVFCNGYYIDATNSNFNQIPDYYKYQKLIKDF